MIEIEHKYKKVILQSILKTEIHFYPNIKDKVNTLNLTIKGPLGKITKLLHFKKEVMIRKEEKDKYIIKSKEDLNWLIKVLKNGIKGVNEGYKERLKIEGTGYKIMEWENKLIFQLGYSQERKYLIPSNVKIKIIGINEIEIVGIDKEEIGRVSKELKGMRKKTNYRLKGIYGSEEKVELKSIKK